MWSKQADTRNSNKNMTSFKNKITNRKRKNSKSRNVAGDSVDSAETDLNTSESKQNEEKKRQQKSGKNRGRNRNKKDANTNSDADNINVQETKDCKESNSCAKNGGVTIVIDKDLETADVVLRNPNNDVSKRNLNNTLKRYSDSFVIENNGQIDNGQLKLKEDDFVPPVLTRAVSGFFVIDHARKARRFSDLFRPASTMKLSGSTESLKINNEKNSKNNNKGDKNSVSNEEKKNTKNLVKDINSKKQKKKTETPTSNTQSPKTVSKKESVSSTDSSSSYLKRVKSKIYKTKTDPVTASPKVDDSSSKSKKLKPKKNLEVNGRIPEDEVAVLTPNGLRKSLTHFDFRLTRQTSNLERIRPKTFGAKKSTDVVDNPTSSEKPVLAKAKSSSAINLSLLRTRRNKILEQVALKRAGNCKDVHNEFDFIAFGSVNNVAGLSDTSDLYGSQTSLTQTNLRKQPSWLHIHREEKGEVKQSQPVSRSGSDRRPDAVREEGLKHQDSASTTDSSHEITHDKNEVATPDSTTSLPATGSKRRINSNINRSESVKEQSEKVRKHEQRKQRRNISDPSHNTTSGDVDLERHPGLSNTDSGSSSNSSISCNGRLSESPSNSVDAVLQSAAQRGALDSDSDMDVDTEPWQNLVPPEELRNLSPHEKKRQDVINEFFHTEGSHVRNLKVLYKFFYKKLQESQILKPEELALLFPNIKEVLDIHTDINKEMRRRRKEDLIVKELGDLLVYIFGDRHGESLKKAAATFCERQQLALEFIKRRRERDSKFDSILAECERKRQCRRLPFQGILPTEMQRLSKYPLLLERLINSIESNKELEHTQQEELAKLKRAHHMSKEILNCVNEAAKVAHNRHRLEEIQKHLDTSSFERSDQPIVQEFRTLDLTKYKLIIEGGMQLRRPNKAIVPVHILLLEEAVFILHREGDRFLLKFFQSGSSAQPLPLSPIIKINTLLVRTNAVCKNALFLVNTSSINSQMYDLIAEDEIKREVWFKHFSDATESYNKREGKSKRQEAATDSDDSESVQDLPPSSEVAERAEAIGGDDNSSIIDGVNETEDNDKVTNEDGDEDTERESTASPEMVAGGGVQTSKVSAEEWPLIQPSQVNIAVPPVHTAESMLTPLEQIRRKDALVKQALEDKEGLVADMLSIPREHFQHIADMASVDTSTSRDPSERVLASIFQVDQLQKAVNQSLNISELEAITAKGGKHPACASQQPLEDATIRHLTVPANLVRDIATSLSSQLTTLLSEVKQMEEERDMLRKELHRVRERLHEEHHLHSPVPVDGSEEQTSTTDCASEHQNCDENNEQISKSDLEEEQ